MDSDNEPARPTAAKPRGTAVFHTDAGAARVSVEVVRSFREVQRGLMFRRYMAPDDGMLFIFAQEEQQSFWMKNTLIPLDMIFVRTDMTVLGVVHDAEPKTLGPRRVEGKSQFVVETNAGWAKKHGVKAGVRVEFEGVNLDAP